MVDGSYQREEELAGTKYKLEAAEERERTVRRLLASNVLREFELLEERSKTPGGRLRRLFPKSLFRVLLRRIGKAAYWSLTGQLKHRLRARQEAILLANLSLPGGLVNQPQAEYRSWRPKFLSRLIERGPLFSRSIPSHVPPEAARALEQDYAVAVPFGFAHTLGSSTANVAAVIHLFYEELAGELRVYLDNVPGRLDLFISTVDAFKAGVIQRAFSGWSNGTVNVRVGSNRGRDISHKFITFRDIYDKYDYVLFLHGKRSHHDSVLRHWRLFLLENLLGTPQVVSSVFYAFQENPSLGAILSQHYEPMRHWVNWGGNFQRAQELALRMGFALVGDAPLDFPSGSMFWARTAALKPLLDLRLSFDDFEEEADQLDGTLAHAIEHVMLFTLERAGFDWIKIARPSLFSHTPGIVEVQTEAELLAFMERSRFRLLDPAGIRPRRRSLDPVTSVQSALADLVQDRLLGVHGVTETSTRIGIGLVSYNNSFGQIRSAVAAAKCSLENVGLHSSGCIYAIDNGDSRREAYGEDIQYHTSRGNIGFGRAHNLLMESAFGDGADFYICLNPDGVLHPEAIGFLIRMAQAARGRALVEALQFPSEHPKPYDEYTFDTPWISGACFAIPKGAYYELGGFDESFFMYCEDVDMSWRSRALGYSLKVCPCALFLHPVTNRRPDPVTLERVYQSGVILARKWGDREFEAWASEELSSRGFAPPSISPKPVPESWRNYADFSFLFSFGQPRW